MNDSFDETPAKKENRLSRLHLRDTKLNSMRGEAYTKLVGLLRWALPFFVFAGLASLIIWPMIRAHKLSSMIVERVPNLMVDKLHLTGIDAQSHPYSLTAKRAFQAGRENSQSLVDLELPEAEISLKDGVWLAGKAAQGRLDQASKKLWLGGEVEFFHDEGYRFLSDEANIDWAQSLAWGEKPVLIQGSFGEIRGQGFRVLDGGKTLIVIGPATARLDLQPSTGSGKVSGKKPAAR